MTLTHEDYMRANEKAYLAVLPMGKKQELVRTVRAGNPEDCMQCLFFKWLETPDGMRQSCAMGYDSEIDQKMQDKVCPVGGGFR